MGIETYHVQDSTTSFPNSIGQQKKWAPNSVFQFPKQPLKLIIKRKRARLVHPTVRYCPKGPLDIDPHKYKQAFDDTWTHMGEGSKTTYSEVQDPKSTQQVTENNSGLVGSANRVVKKLQSRKGSTLNWGSVGLDDVLKMGPSINYW